MKVTATLDPALSVGPINRRLFGSFVEHMGRCVDSGIYEPGHPRADEQGFREDVLELVRELGTTVVRYPGGNFVSGYRWEDGVGPVADRPVRLNLAWHTLEANEFGVHEFIRWADKAGVEPMLAVNLGTRGFAEALELLEYANHPSGTVLSERRIRNGAPSPFAVRMWCLGNEMDGPWQLGHKTAAEYGRVAAETARAMRQLDPGLELVACGSSGAWMPTFGDWETTVLEAAYDLVDYISLHAYYEEIDGDLASFLASGVDLDRVIERVTATADDVGASLGSSKRIQLSVDEWNVWYLKKFQSQAPPMDWPRAPRLSEDDYTAADAVVVGSLLISLLKHADRVTCACLAQLVNAIAPIRAEPGGKVWRQTTFYPFSLAARYAHGSVLRLALAGPKIGTARYGDVPVVDAVATLDDAAGEAAIFVVNRHLTDPIELVIDLRPFTDAALAHAVVLSDDDPHAVNTEAAPDRVVPRPVERAIVADGILSTMLPPVSWTMIRLRIGSPLSRSTPGSS